MADLYNLYAESGADILGDDSTPTLTIANTSTGAGLRAVSSGAAPAISAMVSGTSGTAFKFTNLNKAYVSTNSTASLSYAVRVDIGGTIFYIPAYLGAA